MLFHATRWFNGRNWPWTGRAHQAATAKIKAAACGRGGPWHHHLDATSLCEAQYLRIHQSDALKFDFRALGTHLRVVGNLPYNISTPIFVSPARQCGGNYRYALYVAKRSCRAHGSGTFHTRLRAAFRHVAIPFAHGISFYRTARSLWPSAQSRVGFCAIVLPVFPTSPTTQRCLQKSYWLRLGNAAKLRNTLKDWLNDEDFSKLHIDSQLRAENLNVSDFVNIANFISEKFSV